MWSFLLDFQRPRTIYGRLAWIDGLRFVAIAMMILDHALLFLVPDKVWSGAIRLTLTRCAEPLFVFVFTYLMIYLRRSMKLSRWCEVVAISVITSSVLSHSLGYPLLDVLASIAVAAPVLPLLLRLPPVMSVLALHLSATLSVLPVQIAGIAFDYSPALIIHQMLLTRLHSETGLGVAVRQGAISICLLALATVASASVGLSPSTSIFVVLFGHPVAALVIRRFQWQSECASTPWSRLSKRPLTLYAVHLLVLAMVSTVLRIGG